ncbi:Crp/Fnr family transcriptional regulator [Sphingopyxis sp. SE2]|uniref:Crp/Fnr family transcriptional regulator n=1 Tax=unclassified Sphingopyxis TaxID=2614943 RepID=UPI00050E59AC|nr:MULTISPECIES: Crp/Fnr family transcriptional regulator [unclassified Sphingopyxis]KGB53725.1 Crp/Fnr family transcription regulator [Sphingopyxis sp. LC363]MDT7527827.1 Crp/Fnr family transcriptional regulator [Sphingopyxis sp. SE2]
MGLAEIVNALLTPRERLVWEASLARNAREYMKGADLAREGEKPVALRIVLAGWAQKYKQMPDGRRQILGLVLPGELCDLDLFTVARTDHSIAAVRRLSVAEIGRADAQRLFEQCPNLAPALCWAAIVGAAVQREWTINIGQRNALERVAQLLCEIYVRQHDIPSAGGGACDFLLTQGQMAEAMGLTQVHVNRIVQQLRLRCAVEVRNMRLEIPDFQQLAALASFNATYLHLGEAATLVERVKMLFLSDLDRPDRPNGDGAISPTV